MIKYCTKFNLLASVNDFNQAKEYLEEEDMTEYLKDDFEHISEDIEKIKWILEDGFSGVIILETKKELSSQDLESISEWISGQNSDGLGEGFEQQEFAEHTDEDGEVISFASFDWKTNKYTLELCED